MGDEYQKLNYTINFYEKKGNLLKEQKNKPYMKDEHYNMSSFNYFRRDEF
ncbi:hypothetical protein SAMN05421743_101242 [Thalassobacillus cyri]|uniref:Uncharacterized protein n=1 Tax=Thalassobacillus cyri TaxID=571932 RepID=A0A1H3VYA9_9BACI|nr:hypothetical protein SAMN05421743_101242 [Thalassobacillus cyri]